MTSQASEVVRCRHSHETAEDEAACMVRHRQIRAIAEARRLEVAVNASHARDASKAAAEYVRRKGPFRYDPRGCDLEFSYERAVREAFESGYTLAKEAPHAE